MKSTWQRVVVTGFCAATGGVTLVAPLFSIARDSTDANAYVVQAGDTVVRQAGRPRYSGVATLVEDLSIGVENGADEYMFADIVKVFPLRDGSVLVLDRTGTRAGGPPGFSVRQYDASGKYLRPFGRTGDGPGEYRLPEAFGQFPNGKVVLHDVVRRRVSVYSPTGEALDQWTWALGISATSARVESFVADTAGYVYRIIFTTEIRSISTFTEPDIPKAYERRRPGSTVVDTIFAPQFPGAPSPGDGFRAAVPDGITRGPSLTYWPYPIWKISPAGYIVTAIPNRYAIDLRIPSVSPGARENRPTWKAGGRVVSIRRDLPPVPVSNAERAQYRARHSQPETSQRAQQAMGPISAQLDWFRRGGDIPAFKPAFTQLRIGLDGRIWAQVSMPSVPRVPPAAVTGCPACTLTFRDSVLFDVFESDGTYVGQVAFGSKLGAASGALRGDHVWGVARGPNDVPMVKRWRIAWTR